MSTAVEVQDLEELQEAIAAVRSDVNGVERRAWLLVGHVDKNPNMIGLVGSDASADASLDGLYELLSDDEPMYALVRLTSVFDMSTTVKFVHVKWIGDKIPFVKRGRFGVVYGSIEEHFRPYHQLVETGNVADLAEDVLLKTIEEKSGTRSMVVEGSVEGRQERGFTQFQIKKENKAQPRVVAPKAVEVEVVPELSQGIREVQEDASPITWVLGGPADISNLSKGVTLVAKGEGDIEELKENLHDDTVNFGLYRTGDKYDDIATVKFVYFYWIGSKVKPIHRGKISAYLSPVSHWFEPFHVSLSPNDLGDLNAKVIKDAVSASSGSRSFVK